MKYEVKVIRAHDLTDEVVAFIYEGLKEGIKVYGDKFDVSGFRIVRFAEEHRLTVCFRDDVPVGFMMGCLSKSFFDENVIAFRQMALWSLPKTRGAYLLLKDFIDFGKVNANHIICTIGTKTNIKPATLGKMGFEQLEVFYRMEIDNELCK